MSSTTAYDYFQRGRIKQGRGDHRGAIADYDEALRIRPDYELTFFNRGCAKYKLKDYSGAIADYDEALRIKPDDAITFYFRGLAKCELKDYRGAIADYTESLRIKSDDVEAFNNRGSAKRKLKDYRGAIADYDEALRIKPDYHQAFNNRGLAKYKLGDYRGAIADYDEALRIKPDDAITFYFRGLAKYELKDYSGAIADYDEALRIEPDDAIVFHERGDAKEELGDYRGAIADYDEALRIKPDFALAFNNRGWAKHALKDYRGAIADYTEALRIRPDDARCFQYRGSAKKELGDLSGAFEDYTQAVRLYPKEIAKGKVTTKYLETTERLLAELKREHPELVATSASSGGAGAAAEAAAATTVSSDWWRGQVGSLILTTAQQRQLLVDLERFSSSRSFSGEQVRSLDKTMQQVSQQMSVQIRAIARIDREIGRDPLTRAEQAHIASNPALQTFYTIVRSRLSETYIACKSINSSYVANSQKDEDDYVIRFIEVLGEQLPGISLLVKIVTTGASFLNEREKGKAIGRFAALLMDVTSFERMAEKFARQLTLANQEKIILPEPSLQDLRGFAFIRGLAEKAQDLLTWIQSGDEFSKAEKLGIELVGLVTLCVMMSSEQEWGSDEESVASSLLQIVMGRGYEYRSPCSATPSVDEGGGGDGAGAGAAGLSREELERMVLEQRAFMARQQQQLELLMRERTERLGAGAATAAAEAQTSAAVADITRTLAAERAKNQELQTQVGTVLGQLQSLEERVSGSANQDEVARLRREMSSVQQRLKAVAPSDSQGDDEARGKLGLGGQVQTQLSALDIEAGNKKAMRIKLEHEALKEQVALMCAHMQGLVDRMDHQETEQDRVQGRIRRLGGGR